MKKSNISLRQRLENAWGSQRCENLKAYHSYLHRRGDGNAEWGAIWSYSEETVWAHYFGRMRGFEQIWWNSVTICDAGAYETYLRLYKKYPEIGGKNPIFVFGTPGVHAINCDVIEVAEDGYSVRASYLTPSGGGGGDLAPFPSNGPSNLWERYGAEFVKEDGEWKYLREIVCPDFTSSSATSNWGLDLYKIQTGELPGRPPHIDDVKVADPGPLHFRYTPIQPPQNTAPYPEPYKTLDPDNSYAPFLNYEKFVSEKGKATKPTKDWFGPR